MLQFALCTKKLILLVVIIGINSIIFSSQSIANLKCAEALSGESESSIDVSEKLKQLKQLKISMDTAEFRKTILPILQTSKGKAALQKWVEEQLVVRSEETKQKIQQSGLKNQRWHLIVGAGFHGTALAASVISAAHPSERVNIRDQFLIVEKSSTAGGIFTHASFGGNSPTFLNATSTNLLPGGVFQHSDLAQSGRIFKANDIGLLIALNLYATGVPLLLNSEIVKSEFKSETQNQETGTLDLTIKISDKTDLQIAAKVLWNATGVSIEDLKSFDVNTRDQMTNLLSKSKSIMTELHTLKDGSEYAENSVREITQTGVIDSVSFSRLFYYFPQTMKKVLEGLDIGIIGSGHSAFMSAEPMLGKLSIERNGRFQTLPRSAKNIYIFGLATKSPLSFLKHLANLKLGDKIFRQRVFALRYAYLGIPEALGSGKISAIPEKALDIQFNTQSGKPIVRTEQYEQQVDLVVLATGYEIDPVKQLGFKGKLSEQTINATTDSGQPVFLARTFLDEHNENIPIVSIGAAANQPTDLFTTDSTATKVAISFNNSAPRTVAVANAALRFMKGGLSLQEALSNLQVNQINEVSAQHPLTVSLNIGINSLFESNTPTSIEASLFNQIRLDQTGQSLVIFEDALIEKFLLPGPHADSTRLKVLSIALKAYQNNIDMEGFGLLLKSGFSYPDNIEMNSLLKLSIDNFLKIIKIP